MIKKIIIYLFVFLFSINIFANSKTGGSKKDKTTKKFPSKNEIKGDRLFFDAIKQKTKENYTEALKLFEQAVKFNPKIDAAYYEISLIEYKKKEINAALKSIEKALKINKNNKWYQEHYAKLLATNGKFDKALSIIHKLRVAHPSSIDYYHNEAFFLKKMNKNKEAIRVYQELENRVGIREKLTTQKYLLYLKENNLKAAGEELDKLSEAFPKNVKYLEKIILFEKKNQNTENIIKVYKKILLINPNHINAIMSIADYYKKSGNEEKYMEFSKKAFSNKEINIDTKITILYSYIRQAEKDTNKLNDAFEYIQVLEKSNPENAKTWAIYGDLYNLDNKPKKALEKYKKSLAIKKDVYSVWQQVFFIESDLKNYDTLLEDTEKAKEYFPNQAMVYFFNGLAFQQKKEYKKSNKAYLKGVKMTSRKPILKAQFYSNIAENYNTLKEYEDSDRYFDKALEIEPKDQYVLNNYAYYLSLRGEKLEKAKEMSKITLDLSPKNATYIDTYAWVLYKKGEYKEALIYQESAIELSENASATLYEHLGDIYLKLNKTPEAIKAWKKAQIKGNNSETLKLKLKNN